VTGGGDPGGLREAVTRKGSFAQTMKAVAWSFFGVRKSSEYEKDVSQLNPVHVVIAGLIAVLVFIGVLIAVVHWVVG
jgi:cytochrome b561